MKISLKMMYLLHLCLDSRQTSTAIPEGQSKEFIILYIGDLDSIFKVTS